MILHYKKYLIIFLIMLASILHACPFSLSTQHHQKMPFFYDDVSSYFQEHILDGGTS